MKPHAQTPQVAVDQKCHRLGKALVLPTVTCFDTEMFWALSIESGENGWFWPLSGKNETNETIVWQTSFWIFYTSLVKIMTTLEMGDCLLTRKNTGIRPATDEVIDDFHFTGTTVP